MMPSALSLIIFGASGDLTSRKLVPALYRLYERGRLPPEAVVVGVARSPLSHDEFRQRLTAKFAEMDQPVPPRWHEFLPRVFYVPGDAASAGGIEKLQGWLAEHEKGDPAGARRLFYLAVSPDLYPQIAGRLGELGMSQAQAGWRRLVIEKPFGRDLDSARALNRALHQHWREEQIYRIDHYLGKETVQNLLVFRFANTIFEPIWNHNFIDSIQITVSEKVTVGSRGGYYDRSGVLRDMFQSHLLQVLTLVTMEAPSRFAADSLRNEKVKVLEAIPLYSAEEAARNLVYAQYAGYRQESGVAAQSRTPTYAALRLRIDNWRWQGMPIYLRSGKGLAQRFSEVVVQFRRPPHVMFPLPAGQVLESNRLSLCLQPDEGIHLHFQSKVPDQDGMDMRATDLQFHYRDAYADLPIPEAYERLLLDALQGDASLFMRSDEIERAWEIMDPIIAVCERPDALEPAVYPVGSEGPAEADAFLRRDGRQWLSLCRH